MLLPKNLVRTRNLEPVLFQIRKKIIKYLSTLNQLVSPNYDKDKQITITMDFAENDIKDYKHWLENEGRELMFKTRERINKDKK